MNIVKSGISLNGEGREEHSGQSKDLKSIKIATHLEFSVDLNSKRKPEATFKRGETNYRFREKLNGTSSL